jgi:hypothetical protein
MEDRRRLAAPELTQWVKKIKNKMTSLPPMGDWQDPRADFRHGYVLRLRLSRHEREMLEVAAADEDGASSPLPVAGQPGLAKQVAVLLFLRWYVSTPSSMFTYTQIFPIPSPSLFTCLFELHLAGLFLSVRRGQ